MAIIIDGSGQSNGLAVRAASRAARVELFDAQGNKLSKINGDPILATEEAVIIAGVNEGNIRHLRADRLGNVSTALNTVLLTESFEGTITSTSRWSLIGAGFLTSQTSALGIQINSSNVVAANNGYLLRSLRTFAKAQRAPLQFRARARFVPAPNSVIEIGFSDTSIVSVNAVNNNGAYWQVTTGGVLQPVLSYNGIDIVGSPVVGLNFNNYYVWDIIVDDNSILYTIQDTTTGSTVAERTIRIPSTQAKTWGATRLNAFIRSYVSTTAAPSAPSLFVSSIDCLILDGATAKPWREQAVSSGYGGGLNPLTFAQTTNWANSTAPASATLSNTVAGYATKDGLFQFAAVAGANTDYALFGFQVPTPYSFVCTGVDIDAWNTVAAVAVTPTLLIWGLAYDLVTVPLSTAGARIAIGSQDFPIGAVSGARATSIAKDFPVPLITNPGRFMVLMLRMPVSTATPTQVIQGMVNLRGYFD